MGDWWGEPAGAPMLHRETAPSPFSGCGTFSPSAGEGDHLSVRGRDTGSSVSQPPLKPSLITSLWL